MRPLTGHPALTGPGTILVFHRLRHPGEAFVFDTNRQNCVAPEQFTTVLHWLAAAKTAVVSLDEAADRLAAGDRRRFACLTFDDGYRDNYDLLLPIVQAHAVPVTIYIAPGLLDGTAPLWWYGLEQAIAREKALQLPLAARATLPTATPGAKAAAFASAAAFMVRASAPEAAAVTGALATAYGIDFAALAREHMMDWPMVRALAASPLVEIGAHSLTHPPLAYRPEAEARSEMADSRDRLTAETGRRVAHFAYPYGTAAAAGPREWALAGEMGFRSAVTTRPGHIRAESAAHAWPRIGIGPGITRRALWLKLAGVSALRARLTSG